MKYDELDKVETAESYPKNNVSREKKTRKHVKVDRAKALDVAVIGSIFSALVAVVMLMTSIVTMAMDGVLTEVFKSLI